MAQNESPLITALPPNTDYISYLTIVQHYLTEESLPVLHNVLQNEELTTNIGWDLVATLVPMLPASAECLHDIARLGNPREVILKVTEALRLIDYDTPDDVVEGATTTDKELVTRTTQAASPAEQFATLVSMATVLHSRIRTKYPSRFLSTTLKAVLLGFSSATDHREQMIDDIVAMVKKMSGILRPALPSRSSSQTLSRTVSTTTAPSARDPEAAVVPEHDEEDTAMQARLFQAFVTHVLEEYLLNLPSHEGVPGLAWCTRIMETVHPERSIPHGKTVSSHFQDDHILHDRNDTVGQLVTLAHDLKLPDAILLQAASTPETPTAEEEDDEEPPVSAKDIPLSRIGSALLYTARQASNVLHGRSQSFPMAIFPGHLALTNNCLSEVSSAMGTIGTEPEALIDAVLALGLLALENDNIGTPQSDAQFHEYLQMTSLLASNCPNANLRGHAHYLVSTILRSHPDEKVRYVFIRDTLEHCPFENLKTTAVGWIKGEIVEANMSNSQYTRDSPSMFAKPSALDSLSPYLFDSLATDLVTAPLATAYATLQTNLSFYLAVLNLLYLLITAQPLRRNLDVLDLWKDNDIAASYIQPLREAAGRFTDAIKNKASEIEVLDDAQAQRALAELNVLSEALERVTASVALLNED